MRLFHFALCATSLILTCLSLTVQSHAYDFKEQGYCYKITSDSTVEVTYQKSSSPAYTTPLSTQLSFPEDVTYDGKTYRVTSIGSCAFMGCTDVKEVITNKSMTKIGNSAFSGCKNLKLAYFGESMEFVDGHAFGNCSGLEHILIDYYNTHFETNSNQSVLIEKATNTLVVGTKNAIIPNTVKSIGNSAFYGCSGLTSIDIPKSVESIGSSSFAHCEGLTEIAIPSSVTSIGEGAFNGCLNLKSVTIGESLEAMGQWAFFRCNSLEEINWYAISCNDFNYKQKPFEGLSINKINFGDEVKHIPAYLFNSLPNLTEVRVPNSTESIGDDAFSNCSSLNSIKLGKSLSSLGYRVFWDCPELSSITIHPGNTTFDSRDECNAIIESTSNTLLFGCKNTTIPHSVTSIGSSAFYKCSGLTSLNIPPSVKTIESSAFSNCTNLTSINLPNSIKALKDNTFYCCTGLTAVALPNTLTSISEQAFLGCPNITDITLTGKGTWMGYNLQGQLKPTGKTLRIGSEITSILYGNFQPSEIYCYNENPPTLNEVTFSSYEGTLHVPSTSTAAYFTADFWKNFTNRNNDIKESISLRDNKASLTQWQEMRITATTTPSDMSLLWVSTNNAVAQVNKEGVITATGAGECDIIVSAASNAAVSATCHLVVNYPDISIILNKDNSEIYIGGTDTLDVIITPDNTGLVPAWVSSDENVAVVNNGVVTAVGEGECEIVAKVLDKSASCHITVMGIDISLDKEQVNLSPNEMFTLYPSCSPNIAIEYVVTSSDTNVAVARVVNAASSNNVTGKAVQVVGVNKGTATITVASADGKATPATCLIVVNDALQGDVDGNNIVNGSDVTALYTHLLNGQETAGNADVDGNGTINGSDVTFLYNLLLK